MDFTAKHLKPERSGYRQATRLLLKTNSDVFNRSAPTEVQSPDFADSNNNTANSTVTYLVSTSEAQVPLVVLQKPTVPAYLQAAVTAVIGYAVLHPTNPSDTLPQGVKVGTPTVAQMSFPTLGDQSVAYRVTVPVSGSGLNIDVYVDFIAVQKGRADALLAFEGVLTPIDSTMEQQLATLTVGRMVNT